MKLDESPNTKSRSTHVIFGPPRQIGRYSCIFIWLSSPVYKRPGGGGHSLVSSVPMRDQKNDEKGYFFSRRAVRSADII